MKLPVTFACAFAVLLAAGCNEIPATHSDSTTPVGVRVEAHGISAITPFRLHFRKTERGFRLDGLRLIVEFGAQHATRAGYEAFLAGEQKKAAHFEALPVERPGGIRVVHVARYDEGQRGILVYYAYVGPDDAGVMIEYSQSHFLSNYVQDRWWREIPTEFLAFADSIELRPGVPAGR
jgi:hypothetical protein